MGKSLMTLCLALAATIASAAPPAQPVAKDGSCPTGYYPSGSYCVPNNDARFAVPKSGSCPAGYYPSGHYCLASSGTARAAIPKIGSCPSGYYPSGDYCVSNR